MSNRNDSAFHIPMDPADQQDVLAGMAGSIVALIMATLLSVHKVSAKDSAKLDHAIDELLNRFSRDASGFVATVSKFCQGATETQQPAAKNISFGKNSSFSIEQQTILTCVPHTSSVEQQTLITCVPHSSSSVEQQTVLTCVGLDENDDDEYYEDEDDRSKAGCKQEDKTTQVSIASLERYLLPPALPSFVSQGTQACECQEDDEVEVQPLKLQKSPKGSSESLDRPSSELRRKSADKPNVSLTKIDEQPDVSSAEESDVPESINMAFRESNEEEKKIDDAYKSPAGTTEEHLDKVLVEESEPESLKEVIPEKDSSDAPSSLPIVDAPPKTDSAGEPDSPEALIAALRKSIEEEIKSLSARSSPTKIVKQSEPSVTGEDVADRLPHRGSTEKEKKVLSPFGSPTKAKTHSVASIKSGSKPLEIAQEIPRKNSIEKDKKSSSAADFPIKISNRNSVEKEKKRVSPTGSPTKLKKHSEASVKGIRGSRGISGEASRKTGPERELPAKHSRSPSKIRDQSDTSVRSTTESQRLRRRSNADRKRKSSRRSSSRGSTTEEAESILPGKEKRGSGKSSQQQIGKVGEMAKELPDTVVKPEVSKDPAKQCVCKDEDVNTNQSGPQLTEWAERLSTTERTLQTLRARISEMSHALKNSSREGLHPKVATSQIEQSVSKSPQKIPFKPSFSQEDQSASRLAEIRTRQERPSAPAAFGGPPSCHPLCAKIGALSQQQTSYQSPSLVDSYTRNPSPAAPQIPMMPREAIPIQPGVLTECVHSAELSRYRSAKMRSRNSKIDYCLCDPKRRS